MLLSVCAVVIMVSDINLENVLVARICHDLITPCNAISLGLDAFQSSNDKEMLKYVKEGADKANIILQFMRELFSKKEEDYIYQSRFLSEAISNFAKTFNIEAVFTSSIENIPYKIGQVSLFCAAVLKDLMPFGGKADFLVKNKLISINYTGQNMTAFALFDASIQEITSRNILLFKLTKLLSETSIKVFNETAGQMSIHF